MTIRNDIKKVARGYGSLVPQERAHLNPSEIEHLHYLAMMWDIERSKAKNRETREQLFAPPLTAFDDPNPDDGCSW